ncbi:hypothetical protein FA10DRAFT_281949 [Acaromyces ingoldii]|uniref:Dbl homology domain-containing protein n=1 Tax=Acaromyces ingoldii TaxID=215250 RepID=A0A316YEW3_9BASI|nr:hypothetical protein FA10DRAFT_281949 [Acaromyces ingoldii]PWN87198.1 hypothetical protein FA10DRAFT_281949 [Acaromyces ingoldii]
MEESSKVTTTTTTAAAAMDASASSSGSSGPPSTAPSSSAGARSTWARSNSSNSNSNSNTTNTTTSSRPSSVASSSSSSSMGGGGAHLAASPGLLSPSLASALGIGPSSRRRGCSPHGRSSLQPRAHALAQGRTRGEQRMDAESSSSSSSSSSSRRPSLPTMPSMVNRVSMMSVASFESLPEGESVPSFATPASPSSSSSSFASSAAAAAGPDDPLAHRRGAKLKRSSTEPTPVVARSAEERAAKLEKRRRVAIELLDTERVFVQSLRLINENYYQPLLARSRASATAKASTPLLSRKALGEIFANFADILHLSQELLARLEERMGRGCRSDEEEREIDNAAETDKDDEPSQGKSARTRPPPPWDPERDRLGDVLVPVVPFLKMYSLYVKNFSSALQRIEAERRTNDAFARWLRDTERAAWASRDAFGFGLGFQAHLLTVVQRIPRYRMLVSDLVKATPADHADRADLAKALDVVEHVAAYIDDNIRQHEVVVAMLGIQRSLAGLPEPLVVPGRSLLRRATLLKACRKNVQPREFFLFSDCLVYASPAGQGSIDAAWHVLLSPTQPLPPTQSSQSKATAAAIQPPSPSTNHLERMARPRTTSSPSPFTEARRLSAVPFDGQQWNFRGKFALQDLTVVGVDDSASPDAWLRHSLEMRTPNKSFAVYAESREEKEQWLDAIRDARDEWLARRRTLQADEDSIEAKRERRRSLYNARHQQQQQQQHLHAVVASPSAYAAIPEASVAEWTRPASLPPQSPSMDFQEQQQQQALLRASSPPPQSPLHAPLLFFGGGGGGGSSSGSGSGGGSGVGVGDGVGRDGSGSGSRSVVGRGPGNLRILEDYQAPVWVPDSRADRCMNCSEAFGLWRRKHHCRLCGHVVCYACSAHTFLIASYEEGQEDRPARACDSCYHSVFPDAANDDEGQPALAAEGEEEDEEEEEGEEEEEHEDEGVLSSSSNIHKVDSDASFSSPATPIEASPLLGQPDHDAELPPSDSESSAMLKLSAETLRPVAPTANAANAANNTTTTADGAAVTGSPKRRSIASSRPPPAQLPRPKTAAAKAQLFAPEYYHAFPGARSSTTTAEGGALHRGLLSPQVQAATSGSGTFRLVTPRLTTPTDEASPRGTAASGPQPGKDGSYFAGVEPGSDQVVSSHQQLPLHRSSADNTSGSPNAAGAAQAHLRKKRPLLSAKARLSTVYNLSSPNLAALGGATPSSRTPGSSTPM